HDVTVVCGKPNHPDGVVPPKYRGPLLYRENMEGIDVLRCWLYATPNRGVFKRSIAFLTFMLSAMFFGSFASGKSDVVVATSPQLLCALAGYVVSVLKRKPFVFEVRDLWPKQIIDLGAVRNPIIIGLLTWAEMFLYRRAKAIVTVSPATADEIAARGIPRDKLFTVTNGINERFFAPRGRLGPLRDTYGWNDDIVVMYIGTHGLSQGLTTIIETAEMLQDREDIRFVFAGQGAEREMLMEMVHAKKLRNVQFLPMQTKEKMPEFYAAADICLVPLKKRDYFLYNIPSKMFEIMACARPIILGVEGQSLEILNEASAGVAVDPENARAYADAIRKLADDPELRASYGKNGCEYVLRHYTRKQKAEQYLEYLQRVVDKKRASG
ncbi:MAG TPA: glycosyltransferase family 4 protein, partial [Candidatus Hydrogenedentes bacterium]|nr:glycosyltransferase family 4 protein [Candidatus Hydrogenedentota bacterium]